MTINITLQFASYEDAITALARLRNEATAPKADAPKPEKESKGNAKSPAPTASAPTPAAAPAPAPAASAPTAAPAPTPGAASSDYEPVGKAIQAAVADGKRPQVVAALGKYGAKSGKELKPENYLAFLDDLAKEISGGNGDLG